MLLLFFRWCPGASALLLSSDLRAGLALRSWLRPNDDDDDDQAFIDELLVHYCYYDDYTMIMTKHSLMVGCINFQF